MSNTQFAFLKKTDVPDQEKWQMAIDDLSFNVSLKIHPDLVPFEAEGFLPCTWGDTNDDVGFELFYQSVTDMLEGDEDDVDLKRIIGDNDYCISMVWRGSTKDYAAVMIASAALAKNFDAVISYEGEEPDTLDKILEYTNLIITDALNTA